MRNMAINKRTIYYANPESEAQAVNASGFLTGDVSMTYSTPVAISVAITEPLNASDTQAYGRVENYDREITLMGAPFVLDTRIWVNNAITEPYDYIVVQPGTNTLIRQVDVNA